MRGAKRITNGQRAAVCGLIIAGLTMPKACAIVGASTRYMRDVLPERWAMGRLGGWRWTDDLLAEAQTSWRGSEPVDVMAARLGTTVHGIRQLASRKGWGRRKPVPRRSATPKRCADKPTPGTVDRKIYDKIRKILGHDAALAEIQRRMA